MFKLMLSLMLMIIPAICHSSEESCKKLDSSSQEFGTTLEASVIGKGRVYFHSAPSSQCINKNVFVVPGNYLTVYNEYKGWLYVMFINKNGDDYQGWVPENRIKIHGKYGR